MKRIWTLTWVFFRITALTPGGGMAMLPIMEREFVTWRKWLTAEDMVDVIATVQSLPGLVAINMAVIVGHRVAGVAGAVAAAFASAVAPFVIIAAIAGAQTFVSDSPTLAHAFLGVRAGVAALILVSAVRLAHGIAKDALSWTLAAVSFVLCAFLEIGAVWAVALGASVGLSIVALQRVKKGRIWKISSRSPGRSESCSC